MTLTKVFMSYVDNQQNFENTKGVLYTMRTSEVGKTLRKV